MKTGATERASTRLRQFLLAGRGQVEAVAAEVADQHKDRAGIGIAVYSAGRQLACRVSPRTPDTASVVQLLSVLRSELPPVSGRSVVLVAVLDAPRIVSIDEYRAHGIRLGSETIGAMCNGRMTLILAHVPCLMSWNSGQLGHALRRKQDGIRPLELHVYPTDTFWLGNRGQFACRGGLRERRGRFSSSDRLRDEIRLVAGYLHGQLSADNSIDYAYDAWRDCVVDVDSTARKAIAISAFIGAAQLLDDARGVESGIEALARLTAHHHSVSHAVGDIHDAHLAMASSPASTVAAVDRLRAAVRESGAIVAPGAEDQDFFPGVALTVLASRQALTSAEYERSYRYYRRRFMEQRSWPAVWWQLRAWSTVARIEPALATSFVFELADWALSHQLRCGAFDIASPADAPSFQTACVVEGLLGAVGVARGIGDRTRSRRYMEAARRGLEFCSSLVLDARHAGILPRPARAIGGVRGSHGALLLRADVAGHYLAALTGIVTLIEA